jgi:phage host-nuclease inhibitor protein Gam
MPAKKKKAALPAIETLEQFHATVDQIARLEVSLRGACAVRDAAIQQVQAQYDGPIEEKTARMKSLVALAGTYAKAHRDAVFGAKLRSAATALANFGLRTGNDSLKPLKSKTTWEAILQGLKALGKYVRTVEEIDKQALLDAKLTDAEYATLGLRVDKAERFYVEAKSADANRISTELEPTA